MRALILTLLLTGCAAQIGPDRFMVTKWDICGWEGGVAFEVNFMEAGVRLGCTDPIPKGEEDEEEEVLPE